jgi:hypothetical protein
MNKRLLPLAAVAAAALAWACEASWAASNVGFVSLVRGRPQMQNGTGQRAPMRLMQGLAPGTVLLLGAADTVGFCHEPAATSYRIEGEGSVLVAPDRIVAQSGGTRITTVGRCGATASSSETGGVLLRSIKTPQ